MGSNEIDFARLVDWIEGRLSEEEARAVEERVPEADDATRENVAWLRAFVQTSGETTLASPSPEVRKTLISSFRDHAELRTETRAQERRPGTFRRFIATLAFDSGLQAAGVETRTAAARRSRRQLAYATDVADVVLNVVPCERGDNLNVEGQILPDNGLKPDAFNVRLVRGVTEVDNTNTDDVGEFWFRNLEPGAYEMLLSTEGVEIIVSPVDLHA